MQDNIEVYMAVAIISSYISWIIAEASRKKGKP
jgi:hypothetical protein